RRSIPARTQGHTNVSTAGSRVHPQMGDSRELFHSRNRPRRTESCRVKQIAVRLRSGLPQTLSSRPFARNATAHLSFYPEPPGRRFATICYFVPAGRLLPICETTRSFVDLSSRRATRHFRQCLSHPPPNP